MSAFFEDVCVVLDRHAAMRQRSADLIGESKEIVALAKVAIARSRAEVEKTHHSLDDSSCRTIWPLVAN